MMALVTALAVTLAAVLSSPAVAVAAAWRDAQRLPRHERFNYRYVWWPRLWEHAHLLTRSTQALLSDQGTLPRPVHVGHGVYRLDFRESGWDKRFRVWERFADFEVYFHMRWKYLVHDKVTVYHPPGFYGGTYYPCTSECRKVKPGDVVVRPADWANEVKVGPFLTVRAQDELRRLLCTEAPILLGPHWMVHVLRQVGYDNVDRKVGYYEWFGIRNLDDFLRLVGVDVKTAQKLFQELRELVKESDISEQERIAGRLRGHSGELWFTLDTKVPRGRGQPARNLLPGELDHDAEEYIGHLPTGLPVFSLNAARANKALNIKAGDAQATAPDFIGGNRSSLNRTNDLRIHLNSCGECHAVDKGKDMLIGFEQWARRKFTKANGQNLRDPDKRRQQELESLYLRELTWDLERDRQVFARAVTKLTSPGKDHPGLTVAGWTRIMQEAFYKFVKPEGGVTLEMAADYLGVEPEAFRQGLLRYNARRGISDQILTDFLDRPPSGIRTAAFEDSYQISQVIAHDLSVREIIVEAKKFP